MRALVIDDSRAIRAIVGRILRELRFDVIEAAHGREGLEKLRQLGAPDVVLVDWNMPEMNGLDFVRAVRQDAVYDQVRLLVVTTETEITNVARALEAGANEYVMKPFTKEVLLDKLQLVGVGPA